MCILDDFDIKVIETLAECDMNVCKVASKLFCHRNTIGYHIDRIKAATGLNAKVFYDLCKLLKMTKGRIDLEDE
jgi:sugar diacid utilization regulator